MSGVARSRGGSGVILRLVVQLAVVAVVASGVTGWIGLRIVTRSLDESVADRVGGLVGRTRGRLDVMRFDVGDGLDALQMDLRANGSLLEAALRGEDVSSAMGRLMRGAGLDLLDLTDPDGIVLSSTHYPERRGLGSELIKGKTLGFKEVSTPDGARVAVVERRPIGLGRHRDLGIAAGRFLGQRVVEEIGGTDAAVFVPAEGAVVANESGLALGARAARGLTGNAKDTPVPIRGEQGSSWLAASVPLRPRGEVGSIVVGVNRDGADAIAGALWRSLWITTAICALLGALAGAWISRRWTRPVSDLVRAVDDVAAGRADYDFSRAEQDELGELAAAFSRLHRSLERQQRRSLAAERVAAWREVARHVAHEVKNPLAPIRLTVHNLIRARERSPDRFDELFDDGARTILDEVDQLSRLVSEFSEFARLPQPDCRSVDLDRILDGILDLHSADPGLAIERQRAANLSRVSADPDQIARALKNVVGNAVEAMAESPSPDAVHKLGVRTYEESGSVAVEVSDSGPGLDEEASRRIFEPYFTTKDGGTGLGMAITHRIVTDHGGTIVAEDRDGAGTRVVIRLPAHRA